MSIAKWLLDSKSGTKIHFIHSARDASNIIFHEELLEMADVNSNFKLEFVLESDSENGEPNFITKEDRRTDPRSSGL